MLLRDLVAAKIKKNNPDSLIERLENDDVFLDALVEKVESELLQFKESKSLDNLLEIIELADWMLAALGATKIADMLEDKKVENGLYWNRSYLRE